PHVPLAHQSGDDPHGRRLDPADRNGHPQYRRHDQRDAGGPVHVDRSVGREGPEHTRRPKPHPHDQAGIGRNFGDRSGDGRRHQQPQPRDLDRHRALSAPMPPRYWVGALAITTALATSAHATTPPQAHCLDTMGHYGLRVVTAGTRSALECVRAAARDGDGSDECLATTVDARLATTLRRLALADARWCSRNAGQRPDAGYADAATLGAAARAAAVGVVTDVLGPDLAPLPPARRADRRCRWVVVTRAARLLRALLGEAVGVAEPNVATATRRLDDDTRVACARTATPLAT